MKYKALICDVDGTLMINKIDGIPSKRVSRAIHQAKKLVHVGIASARPLIHATHLFDHLKLKGPSILGGGYLVVDAETRKVLREKHINNEDFAKACVILKRLNLPFFVNEIGRQVLFSSKYRANRPLDIYIPKLKPSVVDNIQKEFLHLKKITTSKSTDWAVGMLALTVSHAKASKKHAVLEIARQLNIETHEIIGVGDGHNDLSLLMACGLKIAMGNAVKEIKSIADYIAPSVEEDGVAHVIEKFILMNTSE